MLKYTDTEITFAEVPDEITLCINISNCPCHCKGCHSSYLAEDIGVELNESLLKELIERNKGITCVSFMGGDGDIPTLYKLTEWVRKNTSLKVCWYSGRELRNDMNLFNFDFIKTGPYLLEYGPLNSKRTNQRFYEVSYSEKGKPILIDTTHKFWK